MELNKALLESEVRYKTSRSGGKGGQHVNKVSSKVEADLDLTKSQIFNDEEKQRIRVKLSNRISKEDILQVVSEEDRSQFANKENALNRMLLLLNQALKVEKLRKKSKPKRAVIEKRLDAKRKIAEKKINRRKDQY